MDYDGKRRPLSGDGNTPSRRYLPDLPVVVDLKGHVPGDFRDSSRALSLLAELGTILTKESTALMPILVSFVNHDVADVVKQSIISGTGVLSAVLEEIALQLLNSGSVERWVEEIWSWMLKFKDAVCNLLQKSGLVAVKALAVKFLEIFVLAFTLEINHYERPFLEGNLRNIDISKVIGKHPIFDAAVLSFEVKQCLHLLLDLLKCAGSLHGSLTVVIINSLAAIGRKRPVHYSNILSSLLGFEPEFGASRGAHSSSIRYSLRNAFLGFLRCTNYPSFAESRDKLLWALRTMSPGESTEQIIRQVDKMSKVMECASRDARMVKDDTSSSQRVAGDLMLKKLQTPDDPTVTEVLSIKRPRLSANTNSINSHASQDNGEDKDMENVFSSKMSLLDSNLNAVEQMIAMIGAMLAEGERGAESLEILISQIQPELLADIVMANMKHLENGSLVFSIKTGKISGASQMSSSTAPATTVDLNAAKISLPSGLSSQSASSFPGTTGISTPTSEVVSLPNIVTDSKRDQRRDPRRLDPRRIVTSGGASETTPSIDSNSHSGMDISTNRSISEFESTKIETSSTSLISRHDSPSHSISPLLDQLTVQRSSVILDNVTEIPSSLDGCTPSYASLSPVQVDQDVRESTSLEGTASEGFDSDMMESDHCSSALSSTSACEQAPLDLPLVPNYVDLTDEQMKLMSKTATLRIIEEYKLVDKIFASTQLSLLARLLAQTNDVDQIILVLQKHIVFKYQHQKGHELAMHILYHLHALMAFDSEYDSSFASVIYEKFLLALAKSLHDSLPASDKSFSKLLGDVPLLPSSVLLMLEDICQQSNGHDGDRITQGLGAVWSLILVRPHARQTCLDIALKCAIHHQEEVRAKAIRLVANKLYVLSYASENIEQFAKAKLFSLVDKPVLEGKLLHTDLSEERTEAASQDTCVSRSQNSEPSPSGSDLARGASYNISSSEAQRYTSLFFALCTKKASLLQIVFDIYGRAPKAVKQSVHRHVPILIRNVGASYSDLLQIISDPPEGCENLIMLVLQILTEEMIPSAELVATVKQLFETKLKDASVLIPLLSSLSKDEVLPIFSRLVDLPIEKFQTALARILEGSAHTGPALTPSEVLVAIHNIDPEKDRVPLKKVIDACNVCFEQRTVFTQQVLAKSLKYLVDQMPLPLLLMRTIIQAIDAFPTLVDFVMEILSKLVNKQIWKMPKLWVGFLKCVSQTQPHSFNVLLQLPPQQLEYFLNRHTNLRAPLSAHASQTSIRNSLPSLNVDTAISWELGLQSSKMEDPVLLFWESHTSSSRFHAQCCQRPLAPRTQALLFMAQPSLDIWKYRILKLNTSIAFKSNTPEAYRENFILATNRETMKEVITMKILTDIINCL